MHVHILGVCGTFMGGVAALAKALGHRVTGSDRSVYPPMSTQLAALGVELIQGYEADQLTPAPDVVIVGNVMTRGMPVIERLLESSLRFTSGPQWLAEHVLRDRWVLAVSGTHGKTTTSSLLAWILEYAGLNPGFLIGGVPVNFEATARLGADPFFVIEADEYDTAFFDKRSKLVHLRARTVVINNIEFDHADIFADVGAIQRQFHQFVRLIPATGRILWNAADANVRAMLDMGCWTPCEGFARESTPGAKWTARVAPGGDFSSFEVLEDGRARGRVEWPLIGAHNVENALAAIAAAQHAGVPAKSSIAALARFGGIRRRLELRGRVAGVTVYDDFAHHPTAIASTLDGLRRRVGSERIVAVLEPRSNTMRMGVHRDTLAPALAGADEVWFYVPPNLGWELESAVRPLGARAHFAADLGDLLERLHADLRSGDHVLIMSNGGFGGLHARLLDALAARGRQATRA
ncbi:MAG TPA: UDP-N-acetylmuramate:L-alanyl-gamma-D-glutamyl-meso-diaminopimelate ligase [Steroidobacteraceae bacterium]|nr:UDP-N-acetylmuramate:L-alanyl-gamma-D-glutamyl-meso-diaminopimelate ligase [Steroidobacteraceae bacterium]